MRKIVFYGAISLDGFLADENDNLDWLLQTDLNNVSTYEKFEAAVETFVMGRKTYEETKKMLGEAELYPGKEKLVFSHQKTGKHPNTTFVEGDVLDIIKAQQVKTGGAIWIVGGGGILKPLLEENLIDEYWVQIAPVLLGRGKRLFEEGDYNYRLDFLDSTVMGEMVELHFKKKV
ncbi:dihydrofolate reductase family protein [Streptococcaceae bacterium ESL0729]|nr:dihydrofolate reductase family protein [Streptococcaceae bacterium ESL0729]